MTSRDDKRERSPLERAKLMLDAKVVIEHYNRIIATIDEHRLVLDRQEADFVMTVEDYQTLRDFACRNDAPSQAINLEGVEGDEMDKSADRAALLTRLMAAGEPRETMPSHALRKLLDTDPFCPSCGHNRDKSAVSSIDNEDGTRSCQMCGTRWQETEFAPSTTPRSGDDYLQVIRMLDRVTTTDLRVGDELVNAKLAAGRLMRYAESARGSRNDILEEAAKVCDAGVAEQDANLKIEPGNSAMYYIRTGHVRDAAAIRELMNSSDGGKHHPNLDGPAEPVGLAMDDVFHPFCNLCGKAAPSSGGCASENCGIRRVDSGKATP